MEDPSFLQFHVSCLISYPTAGQGPVLIGTFVKEMNSFRNWIALDGNADPAGSSGGSVVPWRYRFFPSLQQL